MTTTKERSMHQLSDWGLIAIILTTFTIGYICCLVSHRDDIFH